jgi:hypothetical protein
MANPAAYQQAGTALRQAAGQAVVTQLRSTVQQVIAAGFLVLPSGQALPGPSHYSQAAAAGPAAPAVLQTYQAVAQAYTAIFQTLVVQASAVDATIAAQPQASMAVAGTLTPHRPGTVTSGGTGPRTFASNAEGAEYGRQTWADAQRQLTPEQRAALTGYTAEKMPGDPGPPATRTSTAPCVDSGK